MVSISSKETQSPQLLPGFGGEGLTMQQHNLKPEMADIVLNSSLSCTYLHSLLTTLNCVRMTVLHLSVGHVLTSLN